MNRIAIIVCEHYKNAYQRALSEVDRSDVRLITHPSLCLHRSQFSAVEALFKSVVKDSDAYLFCSNSCPIARLASDLGIHIRYTGELDSSHVICDAFSRHLMREGAYITTDDWVRNWRSHLKSMGFSENSARTYFNNNYSYI